MLVECVPNFSEGRRPEVVAAIRDAITHAGGIVLDVSSDASHNRSVITFVAPPERVVAAAFAGVREAQRHIDLTTHSGCHPRLGAADVVPLIPLDGVTMADCVALARDLGERIGRELEMPVYLYEYAATRPERRNLADVRRGGFEGLRDVIGVDPARDPDFGPSRMHPTGGAVAVGARDLLVAYNVYLGPATNLPVARAAARAVRGSSGGLRGVKALALEVDGQAQVSMNLVDIDHTPMHQAFELVRREAAAHGVAVTWSEIVGLVPERALLAAGARHLQLTRFTPAQLLERRVREAAAGDLGGRAWLTELASPTPVPGGGAAAAYAGALAAALAAMVAALRAGPAASGAPPAASPDAAPLATAREHADRLRAELVRLADADSRAYGAVTAARALPRGDEAATARRATALAAALLDSTLVPRDTARAAAAVGELACDVLRDGAGPAASDALTAAALADAAAAGAAAAVRANRRALRRLAAHVPAADVDALEAEALDAAARAAAARGEAQRLFDASLAAE
ncbi:MAG TPA: glutamate formimidoyltransferase [Gemmatimonadaceae bacterium]|nr:glutamate formimidoyltransferase [Gemmatimonadaceae bacterium]